MTRLAVLSDIHGNLPALEAVVADMQAFAPDHVIVVGDLINGVPFDAEVMAAVMRRGWTAIRGNHEYYLLNHGTPRQAPSMRESLSPPWLADQLRDWLPTISAMPDQLRLIYPDAPLVYVTHGSPGDSFAGIYDITTDDEICARLQGVEESVVICGHTHMPMSRIVGRWHIFNPGSVGAAMDGIRDASYLLLDAVEGRWQPTFRCVSYDFARVEAAFRAHDLDHVLGVEGYLKCQQMRQSRPIIPAFSDWMRLHYPNEGWSYERAEEFFALSLEDIWGFFGSTYQINPHISLHR